MNKWHFNTYTNIFFIEEFKNTLKNILEYENIAIITSEGFLKRKTYRELCEILKNKISSTISNVSPNPDLIQLDNLYDKLRKTKIDAILAIGGGSVIDTAKVMSKMLGQNKVSISIKSHFLKNQEFEKNSIPIPLIVLPTTSGTGSEVTPFATVWDNQNKKKYSLSGNDLYPKYAILDPKLTYSLPYDVTISTAFDAISHSLESIWNRNANPMSIAIATYSLSLSLKAIKFLSIDLDNPVERSNMMKASLLSGLAISHTRTALSHSISYPVTAEFELAHGLACSFTLPEVLLFNSANDDGRLKKLSQDLGFNNIENFSNSLMKLYVDTGAYRMLKEKVKKLSEISKLSDQMITPERAGNNLRDVNFEDIEKIINIQIEKFENLIN